MVYIIKLSRKVEMSRLWQGTEDGEKRKIEHYSDRPETAKHGYGKNHFQPPPRHHHCNWKGGHPVPRVKGYSIYHHHHGRRISMGGNICLKIPLWKATFCYAFVAFQALTCNLILDKTKTPWQPKPLPLLKNVNNNCLPGDNPRHGGGSVRMSLG